MTTSSRSLTRRAKLLRVQRDWQVVRTLESNDDELRQLVSQNSSQPAELVLRGPGLQATSRTRVEVEALRQVSSENVVRLLDVVSTGESRWKRLCLPPRGGARFAGEDPVPALLLEHPPGGSLEALLDRRGSIRRGEAVTVLLAVADGLRDLQAAGWAHGSVSTRSVVLRRNGCPVVAGLDHATPATADSLAADRSGFRALAEQVAQALGPQDARRMLGSLHMALATANWRAVASALLDVAEPEAVLLGREESEVTRSAPVVAAFDAKPEPLVSVEASPLMDALLEGNPLADLLAGARRWLLRRKKLMLVATVPLAATAMFLAVMPAAGPDTTVTSAQAVRPSPRAETKVEPEPQPESDSEPEPKPKSDAQPAPDARSDDPAVAGAVLLEARHECFTAERPDQACLERVIEAGSALYRSDAAALGRPGAAEERDCRGAVLALEQRWGGAALVVIAPGEEQTSPDATQPASVLMIRTEAGWLLREVYS